MKVLVTGAGGQLGYAVLNELNKRSHEAVGTIRNVSETPPKDTVCYVLDITDKAAVHDLICKEAPDAVIHCAAWTAVDLAEEPQNQPQVYATNVEGTRNIAEVCRHLGCRMMYISTDYVFSGQGDTPWSTDCTNFDPQNFYGKTKLEGEFAVKELLNEFFIVRISWAFGPRGSNFAKTMLTLSEKHNKLSVVCDQIGIPTYIPDLARLLVDMIESDRFGTYHATNEGNYISWADFACEIFRQTGRQTQVVPVTTAEYGRSKAARPKNSRLDTSKLTHAGFQPLPHWQDALIRYLKGPSEENV